MTSIQQDLTELSKLRKKKDADKLKATTSETAFKKKQAIVFERMRVEEIGSMKYRGTNFVPAATVYAQIQDRAAFIEWAKENDSSLLQEKERDELLNALVRERLDNEEELPPGVGFRVREYIGQRAA